MAVSCMTRLGKAGVAALVAAFLLFSARAMAQTSPGIDINSGTTSSGTSTSSDATNALADSFQNGTYTVSKVGEAPDYTRGYAYGGVPQLPSQFQAGGTTSSGTTSHDIIDVNSSLNTGAILGCSGVDIGGMINSTFQMGDLGAEFTNYLKTSLAKEALSLIYSSPAVSSVLDGLRAVGHARVSILQQKCDANEIMASATNKRLKSEALSQCLGEKTDDNKIQECNDPGTLQSYIDKIAGEKRWSGTLHQFACDSNSNSMGCKLIGGLIPDFAFDAGTGTGKTSAAQLAPQQVFDSAQTSTTDLFNANMKDANAAVQKYGCTKAMAMAYNSMMQTPSAGGAAATSGADSSIQSLVKSASGDSCLTKDNQSYLNLVNMAQSNTSIDMSSVGSLVGNVSNCVMSTEVNPQVYVKAACALPADQQQGFGQSISQVASAKATKMVYDALIVSLTQLLAQQGSTDSASPNTMNPEMVQNVEMQIKQLQTMRDSINDLMASYKDIANRVQALNNQMTEQQEKAGQSVTDQMRSSNVTTSMSYADLFNQ